MRRRQRFANGTATGFLFDEATADAFWGAIARALDAFAKPAVWRAIQRAGMTQRFGWKHRSQEYVRLYRSLLEDD